MAEAGAEAIDMESTDQKRTLRKRQKKSSPSSSFDLFQPGDVHVDQPVARVKQGFVMVGHVTAVEGGEGSSSTSGSNSGSGSSSESKEVRPAPEGGEDKTWLVSFGAETVRMRWDALRPCLLEYAQYEADVQRLNSEKASTQSVCKRACCTRHACHVLFHFFL
jgi:hypothetical protein